MKRVNCVIVGNDEVDKRELLVRLSSDLSPKKTNEKPKENDIKNNHISTESEEDGSEKVMDAQSRFMVIHNEDNDESDGDDEEDIPDSWEGEISVEGKSYNIVITDSNSQDAYYESRMSLYLEADIFLICFSVANLVSNSLNAVVKKWVPEIRKACPVTPFILVGTQINWRDLGDQTAEPSQRPISPETGAIYAERIGAVR
jgi:GTPase SAR1 family protein